MKVKLKRSLFLLSCFLIILLFTACPPPTNLVPPDTIKIGSFNMQILGATKEGRPYTFAVLASIATKFDILSIQEVGSNNSSSSDETCITLMDNYILKVNQTAGSSIYTYIRGNQYAILYRTDRVNLEQYSLYSGTEVFTYTPLSAKFRTISGNFDFVLLNIHTSPSVAIIEIQNIKTAMSELSILYAEPDVICIGDFNADGDYYSEGNGEDLSGFENYITGIPNSADTTVALSSNTYDRFQMTQALSTDYNGLWGILHFAEEYDITKCEGTTNTQGTELALSDHYPVWCEYFVSKDEN